MIVKCHFVTIFFEGGECRIFTHEEYLSFEWAIPYLRIENMFCHIWWSQEVAA